MLKLPPALWEGYGLGQGWAGESPVRSTSTLTSLSAYPHSAALRDERFEHPANVISYTATRADHRSSSWSTFPAPCQRVILLLVESWSSWISRRRGVLDSPDVL